VEWEPSHAPLYAEDQEALFPAMDEGYLAYREKQEGEVYGPPSFPYEEEGGVKPALEVPLPLTEGGAYKEIRIAIIIDDMGMGNSTRAIAELPAEVTLSFLPYAPQVQEQVLTVLAQGHEVLLHMPMEPMGYENPGPGALLTSLSQEEIVRRLHEALGKFEGYVGVNNHMGSKFTQYREGMELVSEILREKNLFFVDSLTTGKSIAGEIARQVGLRTAIRDVFLDDEITETAIKQQLARLESVARKQGTAIAIGHPHKATLELLVAWLRDFDKKKLRLVPVSELVGVGDR